MCFFQLITLNKLKEIVQKHPDYLVMGINSMDGLKDRVKDFLNINGSSVSLKDSLHFKTNLHHDTGTYSH